MRMFAMMTAPLSFSTRPQTDAARAAFHVTCLLLALALSGCEKAPATGQAASAAAAEPKAVTLISVSTRPVDRFTEITGTLYGEEEVSVAAEVAGRVVEIVADLGDAVQHGAPLARVDLTDFELAVEEQQAALLTALARVGLDELPSGDVAIDALPLVARAQAQADNAQSRLERARKLYERTPPLISDQDFADIQTQHEVAVTTVNVERLNAKSLVADARARASALRQAEQRLRDTQIIAPAEKHLTYRVAARQVSVGEVVSVGQPMFRLVASDRVKFRGQVPERFAGEVIVGSAVAITISSFPEPFAAEVARVSPAVDTDTRTFEVEIEAANPDGRLKPGSFALARIKTGTKANAKFVPESAVLQFAGVQRVFSVRDGKVVEHRVKLAKPEGGLREVLDDFDGVESVINQPRGLSAGMSVRASPQAGAE